MKKYALIIGNDQYADKKLSQLKTPAKDVQALEKVISNEKIGGFKTYSLINKNESDTRREISKFLGSKKPDDLVLVYFSGHGVLDSRGRLFLTFKNTQLNNLSGTAIPSSFVTDVLDDCRSKRQILILDCCYSGAFARGGKKTGSQKAVTESTFEGSGYGRAVLTASSPVQFALEGSKVIKQTYLSLFTHYLLEGLKTGDADQDRDGDISLDEWFEYTYLKVVSKTTEQKPQKWIYEQEGKLLIAKNPNVKKSLPYPLLQLVDSPYPEARLVAVTELAVFFRSQDNDVKKLASANLRKLAKDRNSKVSKSAKSVLVGYKQVIVSDLTVVQKKEKKEIKHSNRIKNKQAAKTVLPKIETGTATKVMIEIANKMVASGGKHLALKARPLRVFLNHTSSDKPVVRELYQKLRAEAWIQPWLDEEELYPGQDWNMEIEKAIDATDVILVCLSKTSVSKEGYIQRELRLALDFANFKPKESLSVIPIRLEECEPPRILRTWHYLDYFEGQRERAFQKLLVSLGERADSLGLAR